MQETATGIYPSLMTMAGVKLLAPHPLDGIDVSAIISVKETKRSKPLGFWHNLQKDVDEFPQFSEDTTTGHAAWNDWPWKLHRINGDKYELYNLEEDPMETTDLSGNPNQAQRLERMKSETVRGCNP